MTWWEIVLTSIGGWAVAWKTIGRVLLDAIDPPWVVKVTGDPGPYRYRSVEETNRVAVVLRRRFRDLDYNKNCVTIGVLDMNAEDFDEKLLDLRDSAREKAKRLNAVREVLR